MDNFTLNVQLRNEAGSSVCKRIRREGQLPAAVYFKDASSKHVSMVEKDFIHMAEVARPTDVIILKSDDKDLNEKKVIVKEIQQEPLKGRVLHVDFQALETGSIVKVKVPVKTEGVPEGVKNQGGILTQASQTILVSCMPKNIPHDIAVDVAHLEVGDRVVAKDIGLPEGVTLKSNPNETIASVVSSRQTKLQEAAEDAAGGVEAATAEGEAGAADASGAAPAGEAAAEGQKEEKKDG